MVVISFSKIQESLENFMGNTKIIPLIDIFVVCCYYSNRYGCADEYLNICQDNTLRDHALYLKNNDQTAIVNNFIKSILFYKNMQLLFINISSLTTS